MTSKYIKLGQLKLIIMFFIPLGLYPFYWFYKQWAQLKHANAAHANISPFWRAVFYPVYCFSFAKVLKADLLATDMMDEKKARKLGGFISLAPFFILTFFLLFIAYNIVGAGGFSSFASHLSFLVVFCILQDTINKILPPDMPKEKPVIAGDVFIVSLAVIMLIFLSSIFYAYTKTKLDEAKECLSRPTFTITSNSSSFIEFNNECLGIKGKIPRYGPHIGSQPGRVTFIYDGDSTMPKYYITAKAGRLQFSSLSNFERARLIIGADNVKYANTMFMLNPYGRKVFCYDLPESIICGFSHRGALLIVSTPLVETNRKGLINFVESFKFN